MSERFTLGEIRYMTEQPLGRLATQQPDCTLQVNPVAFYYNAAHDAIDIGGRDMASSRKFRNVAENGRAAFVIDDIASLEPWVVRCLDLRGRAEAILDPGDSTSPVPGPIIRMIATRIISWGI